MTKEQTNRLKQIFETENHRLTVYIQSKLDSIDDSEDLLQDVYLQLLGNMNVLDTIDNITGWLYTVVKNKIIDRYRRKKFATIALDSSIDSDFNLQDLFAEQFPDTADEFEREQLVERLMQSIEELPEKQRYVFVEQVLNDKTFRELAEETGESMNTLLARKRYAVSFLRKQLQDYTHY
jgi:RNA polymerase sigma factor (sigma-70 family)